MKQLFKNFIINQLWRFAVNVIKNDQPFIIGITGSVGKTSTKEAIAQVLKKSGREVIFSNSSFNTEFGIPLSLMNLASAPDSLFSWFITLIKAWRINTLGKKNYYLVLEYGADKPGDIAFLVDKVPPDIAVLTQIAPTHLINFSDIKQVAEEKLVLTDKVKKNGLIIACADDVFQKSDLKTQEKIIWYGIDARKADVKAGNLLINNKGVSFTLSISQEEKKINSRILGKHQIYQLLAAAACGFSQKISFSDICQVLVEIEPKPGRLRLLEGKRGIKILDDSYNSSPEAAKAALDVLKIYKSKDLLTGRRVAILGNMNELGEKEGKFHQEVGKYVIDRADALIAVGSNAENIAQGARSSGMKSESIITFETTEMLLQKLYDVINRNDVVLIKASQNKMRFERIVKALMLYPEKSAKLLVRQSKFWQKKS